MKRSLLIQKRHLPQRFGSCAFAAFMMFGVAANVWALPDYEAAGPGHWRFDDCSSTSTTLVDSSANQANAQKSSNSGITCSNLGAGDKSLTGHKSVVFTNGATIIASKTTGFDAYNRSFYVAAWIKPTINTQGTIVTKALTGTGSYGNTNAWTLSLSNPLDKTVTPRRLVFTMWLIPTSGSTAVPVSLVSISDIPVNQWTHVAAGYEYAPPSAAPGSGSLVTLYVNGQMHSQIIETRSIADRTGNIRMGSTATLTNGYSGAMDEVMIRPSWSIDGSFQVAGLCVQKISTSWTSNPSRVNPPPGSPPGTPSSPAPVTPGTAITYDVMVQNNDYEPTPVAAGACMPTRALVIKPLQTEYGFTWNLTSASSADIPRQGNAHFTFRASTDSSANPGVHADPGPHSLSYRISSPNTATIPAPSTQRTLLQDRVQYTLEPRSAACSVRTGREIAITDVSVVEDTTRTAPGGAWSFKKLITDMAPAGADVPAFVENLMTQVYSRQTINTFVVDERRPVLDNVLTPWPRLSSGKLDLDKAPFRLAAIIGRLDKRDSSKNIAGEGRFVFSFTGTRHGDHDLTLIMEFALPTTSSVTLTTWVNRWHNLGTLAFPSAGYNTALQAVTDEFATRNKGPGRVNGSALLQLRTNDYLNATSQQRTWDFRNFELSSSNGFFKMTPVAQTPDESFQTSPKIGQFINTGIPGDPDATRKAVLAERHVVPLNFGGGAFQGGNAFTGETTLWLATGVTPGNTGATISDLRFHFARATCSGCHSGETHPDAITNSPTFAHVFARYAGAASELSPFMLGTQVLDRADNVTVRTQGDLRCRTNDLEVLACGAARLSPFFHCVPPLP